LWKRVCLRIGSKIGNSASWNTLARTSRAAAEHFPEINHPDINFRIHTNKDSVKISPAYCTFIWYRAIAINF
jgi:hypothetical protein